MEESKTEVTTENKVDTIIKQAVEIKEQISTQKLNAVQRLNAIEDSLAILTSKLESLVTGLDTTFKNLTSDFNGQLKLMDNKIAILADEMGAVEDIVSKVNRKANATIRAGEKNELNEDTVKKLVIEEEENILKNKAKFLESRGAIVRNDSKVVDDRTFLVGRQYDNEGKEVASRVQYATPSFSEETKKYFFGKKVGDRIKFDDNSDVIEITEIYDMPKVDQTVAFPEEKHEESTPNPTEKL
jgi:hypothetical protein